MDKDTLIKNSVAEELDYAEPDTTKINNNDKEDALESEVLFKSGVEDIAVGDNAIITEESLDFLEPEQPEYLSEEVLFKDDSEEITMFDDLSIMDNSVLSDELASELIQTAEKEEKESVADKFQLDFGDLDGIASELSIAQDIKFIKKPFAVKMFEADPAILDRYNELKNYILSYKKIKSRVSNTADTFNIGREQLFKLSTSGKSLKLYLNLEVSEIESRFNIIDASDTKSYEQVPAFLRIRSNRAMKYAYELIDRVINKFELTKNAKYVEQDYVAYLKEIADKKSI